MSSLNSNSPAGMALLKAHLMGAPVSNFGLGGLPPDQPVQPSYWPTDGRTDALWPPDWPADQPQQWQPPVHSTPMPLPVSIPQPAPPAPAGQPGFDSSLLFAKGMPQAQYAAPPAVQSQAPAPDPWDLWGKMAFMGGS